MERRIIHLNIADFSVAVERLIDTSLKGKPLIIADPAPRAVVFDMSDEAYADGVRKGMLLSMAQRRCRSAVLLPPRPEQYRKVLHRCLEHALHYTPLVERSSGSGHLYLDVTGTHRLFGPAPDIGWRLRKTFRQDLGLDPIWSLAANKVVAKVASRLVKPRGECIVGGGEEGSFLAPLPLRLLPGIAPTDLYRLGQVNIDRVHQAAALSVQELSVLCDQRARRLYEVVRGIDPRPVSPAGPAGSEYCHHHLFSPDTNQEPLIRAAIFTLAQQAGHALRQRHLGCRRIAVSLLYADGVTVTRQAVAKTVLNDDPALQHLALTALYRGWHRRVRVRQIGLACSLIQHPAQQLSLFAAADPQPRKNQQLSEAFDAIRGRFGEHKIQRGGQQPLRTGQMPLS